MASFKINIARIRGCPSVDEVIEAMEQYGLPDSEEYGVLDCSASPEVAYATIVRRTHQTIKTLDAETKTVDDVTVERAAAFPIGVNPAKETLEIYAGAASASELIGIFFAGCLALPVVVDPIPIDIPSAIEKLAENTERFQLRSVRVSDYCHTAYMQGTYAPKFLDTEHGKDFLAEYAEHAKAASVKFSGPTGKIGLTLTQTGSFSYSCNDDDQMAAQAIIRKLL